MLTLPSSATRAEIIRRFHLKKLGLWFIYVLATVQFVGVYLFLEYPYVHVSRFERGYERLPFQTRLLMAPLFQWAQRSHWMVNYASQLSHNGYFFPQGITPSRVVQFYLDIPCVLFAGWVAMRIYESATRRRLLGSLVYPLFLVLCAVSYILHTVQNFRYFYDMPSLAMFAAGLYLIYFRKSPLLLVALFALATLNRETTLLLLPFFMLTEGMNERTGRLEWRRWLTPRVIGTVLPLGLYWLLWHLVVFHVFRHNASEYYPRVQFNIYCFTRLRYYPQLFSGFGFLLPFLVIYRRNLRDAKLRLWLWVLPVWCAFMFTYGILVETRVFGELLPFVAAVGALIAEEILVARVAGLSPRITDEDFEQKIHIARAA